VNAPAKITPSRDRYIPIVKHHCPLAEGDELAMRCSILMLRDQASSRLRICSEDAYGTLHEIERLATIYAYQSMPLEHLRDLRYRLIQLTTCASGLQTFALGMRGEDARG
jgi:hypothetical protein